ncbi:MAG: glycosyltransferase [Candidatus Helarchaeota archaeon]|nr:glycosyltransferase [Candidatus Helarchaeota archaeon]
MKILVIPELDWISALPNRVHKIFRRLTTDHKIHVLYFEHEKKGIKKSTCLGKNLFLHKPPTFYIKNMLLFYIVNAFSIYSYINKLIRAYKIQIIVTTNFLFAPFAIRAARKNSIPIVFDLVDFQPYHINYIKPLPSILKKVGNLLLTSVLNFDITQANHIITTGLPLFNYVKRKGITNITMISNGVDNTLFNPSHIGLVIQKRYNITPPIICFIGAMEYWIDYNNIFETISLLQDDHPSLHCIFIGPSRHYGLNKIKRLAAKYNVLNRIIFAGKVPYQQLPAYICGSDLCILPFIKNYLTHCVIPMKLFEYIACEKPVVSVPLAGVKSVAQNTIFYAGTPREFSNKIQYILTDKSKIQEKIRSGTDLIKKYRWRDLAFKYGEILQRVFDGSLNKI